MASRVISVDGGPIKWRDGEKLRRWDVDSCGYGVHYVMYPSKVLGIGKPFFPFAPVSDRKEDMHGHGCSVEAILSDKKRREFMSSLPSGVRSFFICKGSTHKGVCVDHSVMKGHVIGGDDIRPVSGADIARMAEDSVKVRDAMKAFRALGRYVNGSFNAKKTQFTYIDCQIVNNEIQSTKRILTPDLFGSIKLIYGLDSETKQIVDAVYVVAGVPSIVLARNPDGDILHKEMPKVVKNEQDEAPPSVGAVPHRNPKAACTLR